MTSRIVSDLERVWRFVHAATGVPLSTAMKTLGLERDGELVAGVLYDAWNGVNIWAHLAVKPGESLTRKFAWYMAHYPFVEIGVRRVTCLVEASNAECRRFIEHYGFTEETRLEGAASDGGDTILYRLRREDCRFLAGDASMAPLADSP